MANALYSKALEGMLNAALDLNTAVIRAGLVRGYTPALTTHEFISDLTTAGGSLVATANLTTPTITGGVFDADDVTFATVTAGAACQHLVIYQASAVTGGADVATSAMRLIYLIDTTTGVTLPVTPNGGDIKSTFDSGANKIFAL